MNKLCYRMECRVESVSRFVCVHTYVNIFEKNIWKDYAQHIMSN